MLRLAVVTLAPSSLALQQEEYLQRLAIAQRKHYETLLTLRNKYERQSHDCLHDTVVSGQNKMKCLQREREAALQQAGYVLMIVFVRE